MNQFFFISQNNSILDFDVPWKRSYEPIRGGYIFQELLENRKGTTALTESNGLRGPPIH